MSHKGFETGLGYVRALDEKDRRACKISWRRCIDTTTLQCLALVSKPNIRRGNSLLSTCDSLVKTLRAAEPTGKSLSRRIELRERK